MYHRPKDQPIEPYGCAVCGEPKVNHGMRFHGSGVSMSWIQPSEELTKTRMLLRRALREAARSAR